jgi:beta-glucosidase-like glycosyl hydrolase
MTRNTHDRLLDHHGTDLDTNILIDGNTTYVTSGDTLHQAIVSLEDAIALGGGTVPSYALVLDDAGGGVTYVGEALPGSLTSAASWRIKRITEVGPDVSIEWSDGDSNFDNVWDDRLSLSYS